MEKDWTEFLDFRAREAIILMNSIPGLKTAQSCAGHVENDACCSVTRRYVLGLEQSGNDYYLDGRRIDLADLNNRLGTNPYRPFNEIYSEVDELRFVGPYLEFVSFPADNKGLVREWFALCEGYGDDLCVSAACDGIESYNMRVRMHVFTDDGDKAYCYKYRGYIVHPRSPLEKSVLDLAAMQRRADLFWEGLTDICGHYIDVSSNGPAS